MSVPCKREEDNSGFRYCIQKQPKLELEKGIDYEEKKKNKIDRYKRRYPLHF